MTLCPTLSPSDTSFAFACLAPLELRDPSILWRCSFFRSTFIYYCDGEINEKIFRHAPISLYLVLCYNNPSKIWTSGKSQVGPYLTMETSQHNIGFEVLTTIVTNNSIFWDITLCSPLKINLRSRGICYLHLQGIMLPTSRWFLAWFILRSWQWRRQIRPKRQLTFNELHGVISQKTEYFILIQWFL
jgi:hypothetical protein